MEWAARYFLNVGLLLYFTSLPTSNWSKLLVTLPWQWSLITVIQLHHSFHPMFPTDHCRFVYIFCRKVRWRSKHVQWTPVVWCNVQLQYSKVLWRLWLERMALLVHLYKRYRAKWVTCIRAFDVRNDFLTNQVTCNSCFGCAERQILFSDDK